MTKKLLLLRPAALLLALTLLLSAPALARASFPDVESGSWYEADVNALAGEGILLGFEDGTFRPQDSITAGQFITIVARCAGLEEAPASSSHWAAPLLQAALTAVLLLSLPLWKKQAKSGGGPESVPPEPTGPVETEPPPESVPPVETEHPATEPPAEPDPADGEDAADG